MQHVIFDWFNLVKRYTHVQSLSELDEAEIVTKVTYGLLNNISNIIIENKPDVVYFCSDNGYNKRAKAIVKNYKENRKRMKSLTEEEKEKSYLEYIKKILYTLPTPFIEVKNTEADFIIYILINYIKRLDNKAKFTVVSNDSDFIQILDDNVELYNFNKGYINKDNWYKKYNLDFYFNHKNYALGKSIVGDKSDNIDGIKNWGWQKVSHVFNILNLVYNKDMVYDNVEVLHDCVKYAIDNNTSLDKKDLNLLKRFNNILTKENKKIISDNQSIIDLSNLENPFIYKINNTITRELFERKLNYSHKKFLKYLCLNIYEGEDEYHQILKKNAKAATVFKFQAAKTLKAISIMKNRKR